MKCSLRRFAAVFSSVCVIVVALCVVLPTGLVSAAGGTTYYVSANGSGDGLSEANPMSLFKINGTLINGGDKVLFRRGDIFYGSFIPQVYNANTNNRAEIGAYGSGALPIFSNAKIISSAWTKEGEFYSFDLSENGNYSGVKNDNANVGFMEDSKGVKHGIRQKDAASCTGDYDFYCTDTKIYVKSSKDPYAALGTLTLNTHAMALFRITSNMNIHDIHFRDTGYGIVWNDRDKNNITTQNVRIYNCVFDNIGGIMLNSGVKAGNAVEFYNFAKNVTVDRNVFRDTFDVAFTCQGGDTKLNALWQNITVKENVFVNNTQAVEFWCQSNSGGISKLTITDNVCLNQGEGWGTVARDNKKAATDVLAYNYYPSAWDMTISNNTFFHTGTQGSAYYMPTATVLKMRQQATIDSNRYYFPTADSEFSRWDQGNKPYSFTFAQWQKTLTGIDEDGTVAHDANSTITAVGSGTAQHKAMLKTAETSLDFNEIVKAVSAAGVYCPISVSNTTTTASKNASSSAVSQSASTTTTTQVSGSEAATTVADASGPDQQTPQESEPVGGTPDSIVPDLTWVVIVIAVVVVGGVATLLLLAFKKKKAKPTQGDD